jgi:hypothetical protein
MDRLGGYSETRLSTHLLRTVSISLPGLNALSDVTTVAHHLIYNQIDGYSICSSAEANLYVLVLTEIADVAAVRHKIGLLPAKPR